MLSRRSLVTVGTAALLTIAPAFGQAPARVRGIIEAIEDGSITVKERDGRTLALKTGAETTYADVVPSSLEAIKLTDFIGTASKGPSNHWVAVEIVIIPESMRAGRKGYAAWDSLPDPSSVHASATTATSMTNGLVSRASPVTQNLTNTSMTNGNLTSDEKGHLGECGCGNDSRQTGHINHHRMVLK